MRAIAFILRGCPAGWLGAYGNEWVGTPNLDRIAAEGVVFDRHISDSPDAAAACAAWLSHDAKVLGALRTARVPAVVVRANHPDTDGPEWYYAGWQEVFDARPEPEDKSPLDALLRTLPGLLDRLAAWPDFLLWIELDRLLPPWNVRQDVFEAYVTDDEDETEAEPPEPDEEDEEEPDEGGEDEGEASESEPAEAIIEQQPPTPVEPWSDPPTGPFDGNDADAREWLHSSFAAVVTSFDAELGRIFEQLRARAFDQSATWLITSDLGYPLGEHGQIGLHRPWLYEELVHLPLIVRMPGAAEAGRRVNGFTQPPDLAPTVLEFLGVPAPEALPGYSLSPLLRGEKETVRTHAITTLELGGAAEAGIRTDDWAYVFPLRVPEGVIREPQLFEKPDDRWEVNDMRSRNIDRADELEQELRNHLANASSKRR